MTSTESTTQVYRVYIKATAQQVFDALTKPEWTQRYGYGGLTDFDLTPGAKFATAPDPAMVEGMKAAGYPVPDVVIDGEVIEVDAPHKLVLSWRMVMDPAAAEEGFTTLTYEITESAGGVKLTLLHDLAGKPQHAAQVEGAGDADQGGGGWPWVLSDLKSLLETGSRLAG
ncbi:SRPBCC domain-containing protein [Amycolatopsis taiwanensis]|uniref:Transcriptional regulator n=1 Tax=Amycolatopsis taiwanensis TaxID=342230 RepID=A0A9W6VFH1_9PSEU|nr:SRPBCC domain-containing protein [Amycolatopsis taiwanensis]GLY64854.1 transcriptional regulator [Amycolatopsis taiwanensis]